MLSQLDVLFRSSIVQLPRLVPPQVLSWTDPEGPYPLIINLPSRGSHSISLYIFIKYDLTPSEAEALPVVLDFHGGGFFLGSCLEQAPFCSKLARELGAVVISVDYRLAPTHAFPAPLEDAEDVLQAVLEPESKGGMALREAIRKKIQQNWASLDKDRRKELKALGRRSKRRFHRSDKSSAPPSKATTPMSSTTNTPLLVDLDPTRIATSGFSSGGNIALNLAISLQEPHHSDDWPSVFKPDYKYPIPLLLYYPSFDARQLPSERTLPADLLKSSGFWAETADRLAPTYLPRSMAGHPRASPGLADIEGLHKMARMILILPGLDSLADQSEVWVKKVKESGRASDLRLERYPAMKHGWTQMPDGWLNPNEKNQKFDIYDKTIDFTRRIWAGDESVLQDSTQI
jgi:acetyl esterase/lipase